MGHTKTCPRLNVTTAMKWDKQSTIVHNWKGNQTCTGEGKLLLWSPLKQTLALKQMLFQVKLEKWFDKLFLMWVALARLIIPSRHLFWQLPQVLILLIGLSTLECSTTWHLMKTVFYSLNLVPYIRSIQTSYFIVRIRTVSKKPPCHNFLIFSC